MLKVQVTVLVETEDGGPLDYRLDELLGLWANYMHTGSVGTGYPPRSPGLASGKSDSIDDQVRRMDLRLARTMDALIDSLPHNERLAIERRMGLTADVWRLRESWEDLEARARRSLRAMMKTRRVE
jgi:hypothetical protein